MKTKYLIVSIGVAFASSSFFANADWDSSSADATVTADVLNQLTVSAPTNGNNGALGKILINETKEAQLDFNVQATKGYQLQFNSSVTACQKMGENGHVEIINSVSVPLVPESDSFIYPIKYTYHAPEVAKIGAECMVNLAASYL